MENHQENLLMAILQNGVMKHQFLLKSLLKKMILLLLDQVWGHGYPLNNFKILKNK